MKIKYFIITKIGIKSRRYTETGLSWDEWLNDSVMLYNKYCRPSLKNQTDQDFTLLTFYDESVAYFGESLPNEEIVFVKDGGGDIINAINSRLDRCEYVIITILDRDDCLKNNFIEISKNSLLPDSNVDKKYIDILQSYIYDHINKKMYTGNYYPVVTSPFVTIMEKVIDGKIYGYRFCYKHKEIKDIMNGVKLKELNGLQVIHRGNLCNKIRGTVIDYNSDMFCGFNPNGFEIKK